MDLSKIIKTLILSLGLTTNLNIFFTPPEVSFIEESFQIETKLENAITKEVEALIMCSTKVGVEYKITLFTKNKKIVYNQNKSLLYNSLNSEISLFYNGDNIGHALTIKDAMDWLSTVKNPIKNKGRLVVIKAKLVIPDLNDQSLADSLWQGIEPRITYKFTGD